MITDDDLLLYYYRELDAEERARIGAALGEQPELARRLHALVSRLDAAANLPEVPVPAQVQERWAAALDRAATQTRVAAPPRRFSAPLMWQAAAAAVTVFALIFSVQRLMQPQVPPIVESPRAAGTQGEQADPSAYENGLKFHLASTERRIAGLDDASPEERARLIETIMSQNRMYALAAERAGEPQLARVLRAFNPILEGLADGGSGTAAADVAQLSFELRIMQARLGAGAATTNTL
jgi:hypothetical protein